MSATVDIDRAFAEELTALESFFDRRAGEHQHFHLGRQDPDVRRILEAVAFFSARTRLLAVENVRRLVERVVRGQLDYLLTPIPTAGLLEINVDGLAAPALLPRATEVRVETPDRTVGIFTTARPLALLPVVLTRAGVEPVGERDHLVLELDALVSLRGPQPALSFHVDYRGSYRDSLRLFGEIRAAARGGRVSFDDDGPERAIPAEISFGAPAAAVGDRDDDGVHPIERLRSFFQSPAQDLFFRVMLPSRPRQWSRARVYLELGGELPPELYRTSAAAFPLHVVPISNVRRGDSEIIACDGTKDAYAIRDARTPLAGGGREAEATLAAVIGVYLLGEQGRTPIPPGLVADSGPVYDLLHGGAPNPGISVYELALRVPGAFAKSAKVVVDARWYQPSFDVHAAGRLTASLQTRRVEGTRLSVRGDLALHRTSALWEDALGVLHLLALKTKPELTRDELMTLARYAGADKQSAYRRLPELVQGVRASVAPENGGRGTIRYVYELVWRVDDPDFEGLREDGLVRAFEDRLAELLEAWLADEVELTRFQPTGLGS
jgi:type VI secretion system protein ImpG